MFWFVLFPLVLGVLLYCLSTIQKKDKQPPGPFKWPIIGNVFDLYLADSKYPQLALQKLADVYGDVMSLNLGVHKMVVLSSSEVIRDLMKRDELIDRYELPFVRERGYGKQLGIIHGCGESWSVLRKFTISALREYGFAKKPVMEETMKLELTELLESMKREMETNQGILNFDNYFGISVVNLLWTSVTGKRFSSTDPKVHEMIELNARQSDHSSIDRMGILFPFLRHLIPDLTGVTDLQNIFRRLQDFMKEMIEEVKLSRSPNDPPSNFIDAFLRKIETNEHPAFNEEELIVVLMDLFLGGSETTANMLSFAILYMALHPDIQKKVQTEIESVGKGEQFLSLEDSKKMPFTQATTLEIFRLAQVIPIPFGRRASKPIPINGFVIPKGTLVAYNLNSIQMDPKFWKDPDAFRPQRFLNSDMKIVNDERVPLFGFGKRICPGETLARNSFFMYFTTVLKKFEFSVPPGQVPPTTAPRPNSNTQAPLPYSVLVAER